MRRSRLPEKDPSVTLTAADLEPSIHQKGVDMRLGLDIAALTLKAGLPGAEIVAMNINVPPE